MPTTYLLIANAQLARIWRSKSELLSFREIARLENPSATAHTDSISADPDEDVIPLRDADQAARVTGGREPCFADFAEMLAGRLCREFAQGSFDSLVLVSEPQFLRRVQSKLPATLRQRVRACLEDDLCAQSEFEIKRTLNLHFSPSRAPFESAAR